jgi:hypothetical protein
VETVWSLEGGDTELSTDWIGTEGLSGDEALTLDSTGVMLQDCDARSDAEDKLCECSGSVLVMQHSVGVPLAFMPGCEQWVIPLPGVSVDILARAFGVEDLLLVAKTLSGVVDDVLSVDVSPIVCEEDVSILDEV